MKDDNHIDNYNRTGFLDAEQAFETLKYHNGNLIDVIAAQNGWNPLQVYEEMRVIFGNRQYVVIRNKDLEG